MAVPKERVFDEKGQFFIESKLDIVPKSIFPSKWGQLSASTKFDIVPKSTFIPKKGQLSHKKADPGSLFRPPGRLDHNILAFHMIDHAGKIACSETIVYIHNAYSACA